ncbi:MAG: hypothetical protein HWN51_06445 [Desulfobacterales bacterium]|nr:hypothetical protein [Desulfobacterales bacterium]
MDTRNFGRIASIRGKIEVNMSSNLLTGTKVRRLDKAAAEKMAAGSMRGTRKLGYGYPVRKVREDCRKKEVTLPSYVARELGVMEGNFVVWCQTGVAGVLTIAEVMAVYELDVDGLRILGRQVGYSKVRKSSGSHEITVPKPVQAALGEPTGESMMFSLTHYPGVVTVAVIKKPDNG